jgi:hypothetical protein
MKKPWGAGGTACYSALSPEKTQPTETKEDPS